MSRTKTFMLLLSLVSIAVASGQEAYNQSFKPDVPAPDGFRTNRTSYSAIMDVLAPSRPDVTEEQLAQLRQIPLEVIFSAVGEYRTNYAAGFANTRPGERLVGRALTLRFLPPRPDLSRAVNVLAEEGNWDRRYYARAAEEASPGDVLVAELGGSDGHNLFGDMGATGIQMRGAAGVVIDGGMRDLVGLQDDRFEASRYCIDSQIHIPPHGLASNTMCLCVSVEFRCYLATLLLATTVVCFSFRLSCLMMCSVMQPRPKPARNSNFNCCWTNAIAFAISIPYHPS